MSDPHSLCFYDQAGRLLCPACRKPMGVKITRNGRKYAWCHGNSTVCSDEDIAALEAYHRERSPSALPGR